MKAASRLLLQWIFWGIACAKKRTTVKLVILAGEANVEGYASLKHLTSIVTGNETGVSPDQYQHLWHPRNNSWKTQWSVNIAYDHEKSEGFRFGPLDMSWGHDKKHFGPEVQIGYTLSKFFPNVCILKAGWKSRSLYRDFLSPGGATARHVAPGYQWFRLRTSMDRTMKELQRVYGRSVNIEILGMIWWHGYTDMWAKPHADLYAQNLKHFVQDIRKWLRRPLLPVTLAAIGGTPHARTPLEDEIFQAQQNVTQQLQLINLVDTLPYAQVSPFDTNVRYFGRADTMVAISTSLAQGILGINDFDSKSQKYETEEIAHASSGTMQVLLGVFLFSVAIIAIRSGRERGYDGRRRTSRRRSSSIPIREIALT